MREMNYIHAAAAGILMACFVLLTGLLPEAHAQEVPQWSATSQEAPSVISLAPALNADAQSSNIVVEATLNKTQIVNLSGPVRGVVVTNEGIADVRINPSNEYQVFIVPKGVGTSNILFMNDDGALINQIEVQVTMDADELRQVLKQLLPNENIDVTVHGENVFLSGNVQTAVAVEDALKITSRFVAEPANVTNMLSVVGSQQVIIQVRVSEMGRGTVKELAVGLSGSYGGTRGVNFTTATPDVAEAFITAGSATRVFNGLSGIDFEALEQQSMSKTLAEPTLTARSGETATFTSGGEIPVRDGTDDNGNAEYTLEPYGILLEFTPIVLSKGEISLKVMTEISEIDTTSVSEQTGFTTKNTETTVTLPSGGSMMISGLIENNSSNSISGFPFLKDIPILGVLFRSTEFQNDETELVITVTAYLVEPTDSNAPLALPTDGFEPASDMDLYLLGRLHREYGKGERPFWSDSLSGPFGYIMK